jgi:Tfp pilus assembly protein PilF
MDRTARVKSLEEMMKKEPHDLFLNYALAIEYLNDINFIDKAEAQFKFVLSLDENYIAAYYQLGKLYEVLSKTNDALIAYKKGLSIAKLKKDNKSVNEFNEAIFMLED